MQPAKTNTSERGPNHGEATRVKHPGLSSLVMVCHLSARVRGTLTAPGLVPFLIEAEGGRDISSNEMGR
jgi:hypothetical protein